jgi:hypothetical protein
MFRWLAIVAVLFVSPVNAGWFSYDSYEDCMLGKMKGQNTTMYLAADKECKKQFKVEFALFKSPVWHSDQQDGEAVVRLEELAEYEVTSGEFQISDKHCSDSKPDDFRPASIRFQNGVGKFIRSADAEWSCVRAISFRGRYK